MSWQEIAHTVRPVLNEAATSAMPLVVRSLVYVCWKCSATSNPPAVLHPGGATDQYSILEVTSGLNLAYVQELMTLDHNPIAATIKPRYSKTRGERYLSHGCSHCDALFGEFPLQESITAVLADDAIADLPIQLAAERPIIEWWALTSARGDIF
ncbi:hypothetical protein GCM10011575_42030 [Microlunatus endophyticus]|uniref:Uncharacterized protein n=1 Tax=Microlunatus endophyticus TaxID=1716077 RepID=A0A917W7C8_9ACTN|nr:hypothetical protein [Microlunatus endophyticus]GGL79228.1 hypothetical protein GCM10011575_42030 [Microlunatus endophyticus]